MLLAILADVVAVTSMPVGGGAGNSVSKLVERKAFQGELVHHVLPGSLDVRLDLSELQCAVVDPRDAEDPGPEVAVAPLTVVGGTGAESVQHVLGVDVNRVPLSLLRPKENLAQCP
jgi:hypothetical protein